MSTVGTIPPAAIMQIFGIDKFMSECRAVVNFDGNAVATLFVGRWDRAVDSDRVRRLGPDAHADPAPVVGDAAEPSPVLAGQPQPAPDETTRPERPTTAGQGRPS